MMREDKIYSEDETSEPLVTTSVKRIYYDKTYYSEDETSEPLVTPVIINPSILSKFVDILSNVTVEPILFLMVLGVSIRFVSEDTILVQKVCLLSCNYSMEVCEHIEEDKYSVQNENVQKLVTKWKIFMSLSICIPSIFFSIVVGPWSDKHGRKPFILIPIFGLVVDGIIFVVTAQFIHSPVYLLLFPGIVQSMFGGYGTFVCCLSYLTDVTTSQTRTTRLAMAEGIMFVALPIGMSLGGILYKSYGSVTVFVLAAASHLVALLYGLALKESKPVPSERRVSIFRKLRDLFHFENLKEGFLLFKGKREGNQRKQLIFILLSLVCFSMCDTASKKIGYLFCQKVFEWDNTSYSWFQAASTGFGFVVILIAIPILSSKIKLRDSVMAVTGVIAGIFGYTLRAYVLIPWVYYIGGMSGTLSVTVLIACRSIVSKIVSREDTGKVFSFVTCCEQAVPVLGGSLGPLVYSYTLSIFPGSVYAFCAMILTFPLAVTLWLTSSEPVDGSSSSQEREDGQIR